MNASDNWTLEAYISHNEEMRRLQTELERERDRRYAEVRNEQEKALKIKETADLAALGLARDIQTYKDEKANELRSQIERERGTYATHSDLSALSERFDAAHQPVLDYISSQRGVTRGVSGTGYWILAIVAGVVGVGGGLIGTLGIVLTVLRLAS